MWTFYELKSRAKNTLRTNYGTCLLAIIVCQLISGAAGNIVLTRMGGFGNLNQAMMTQDMENINPERIFEAITNNLGLVLGMFAVMFLLSLIVSVFIGTPLTVGQNRFFNEAARGNTKIQELFFPFANGAHNYLNIVKTGFLKTIFLTLWGLLGIAVYFMVVAVFGFLAGDFLGSGYVGEDVLAAVILFVYVLMVICCIPMIIKSYEYMMIDYILTDESDISWREAFKKSKQMMSGQKFKVFLLGLSFIGWYLLGGVMFGFGVIFVLPYVQMTFSHLYIELKNNCDTSHEDYAQRRYYEED